MGDVLVVKPLGTTVEILSKLSFFAHPELAKSRINQLCLVEDSVCGCAYLVASRK